MKKLELNGIIESNCYILDKENKCFIIDPGADLEQIKANIMGLEVVGILLTHGHFDHIDLIGNFDVPIYIHKDDEICLKRPDLAMYSDMEPSFYYPKLKIVTVNDNDEISFDKDIIKVIHTPGHSKGSVCYLYKNKLFSGDTLFHNCIGRTDLPGGSNDDMKKSIVFLLDNLNETIKVYPGHEENTSIKEEKENNPYYLYYKKH